MSILSSRAATWIVPIWLIVLGLIGLLGVPLTSATSVLLIIAGLVPPTIALNLWNYRRRASNAQSHSYQQFSPERSRSTPTARSGASSCTTDSDVARFGRSQPINHSADGALTYAAADPSNSQTA
jgi:hypothetical protein